MVDFDWCVTCGFFFFFKAKNGYEVRNSYWSSYVCSSDLTKGHAKSPKVNPNYCSPQIRKLRHDSFQAHYGVYLDNCQIFTPLYNINRSKIDIQCRRG